VTMWRLQKHRMLPPSIERRQSNVAAGIVDACCLRGVASASTCSGASLWRASLAGLHSFHVPSESPAGCVAVAFGNITAGPLFRTCSAHFDRRNWHLLVDDGVPLSREEDLSSVLGFAGSRCM